MKENKKRKVRQYLGEVKYVMESSPGRSGCLRKRLGISSTDMKEKENRKWEDTKYWDEEVKNWGTSVDGFKVL